MGLPEPPDNPDSGSINGVENVTQNIETDSESEGEYDGYSLLPGAPEDAFSEGDDNEDEEATEPINDNLPQIIPMENVLVQEVWGPQTKSTDIDMDNDKVDEVKKAMSNFTLPSTSIPAWASAVPEDMWKQTLMDKLKNLNKD